jgi:type II restriction enzyme
MTGELSADYKSGSQSARVVTEAWGADNFYCPNCSSPKLDRLAHNTQASDFSCPRCKFRFQLKGQKTRLGSSITDGAYDSMMRATQRNEAPSYYFLHYEILGRDAALRRPDLPLPAGEGAGVRESASEENPLPFHRESHWVVRNLLLIPHFAFPPSAIIKRPPLSAKAQRAGWVGCNFALDRIPSDARIPIVTTIKPRRDGDTECVMISPPEEVRAKFKRIKPLRDLSVTQRGWTLDVLNLVRRLTNSKLKTQNSTLPPGAFSNADLYAFEKELAALHPDNRHIRDKIRQQLQVLRDTGFLTQPARGLWQVK